MNLAETVEKAKQLRNSADALLARVTLARKRLHDFVDPIKGIRYSDAEQLYSVDELCDDWDCALARLVESGQTTAHALVIRESSSPEAIDALLQSGRSKLRRQQRRDHVQHIS